MMLAGQAQMLGIGSGRLSGTRSGGPASRDGATDGRCGRCPARGTTNQPGGLAATLLQSHVAQVAHPARLLQPAESALSASWEIRIICVVSI